MGLFARMNSVPVMLIPRIRYTAGAILGMRKTSRPHLQNLSAQIMNGVHREVPTKGVAATVGSVTHVAVGVVKVANGAEERALINANVADVGSAIPATAGVRIEMQDMATEGK